MTRLGLLDRRRPLIPKLPCQAFSRPGGEAGFRGRNAFTYLRQVDVGNDDDVDGARGIFGLGASIATGVVAVLALSRAGLPGHTL